MLDSTDFGCRNINIYILTLFSTIGVLFLVDTSLHISVLVSFILLFGFFFFFQRNPSVLRACRESKITAFFFTTFTMFGNNRLDYLFKLTPKSIFLYCSAYIGVFIVFLSIVNSLYAFLANAKIYNPSLKTTRRAKLCKVYLISFASLWVVYLIVFLNQYPGSLSCDTPGQLMQAMYDRPFENANPFINTFILALCIQSSLWISGSVNTGVAIYTFFQFTLAAIIFAYTISVIYKHGFHTFIVFFVQCFFNFMPYNIVYAIGMWKDTFFALLFLATLTFVFDTLFQDNICTPPKKRTILLLFFLTILTSLARNSGWSSLLVFGILLLIYAIKHKFNFIASISLTVLSGIFASFLIILFVYPSCGIAHNGGITVGISVPLQQVSRVVAYNADISDYELNWINQLLPVEKIRELYDPIISDPIKFRIDQNALSSNIGEYTHIWLSLGLKNPKIYLDAFLKLTERYWSLEASGWIWDTRIFDNPYGVERTPFLLGGRNLADALGRLYNFPNGYVLATSSLTLWLAIFLFGLSSVTKSQLGKIMYIPVLMIFIGLLFTSPVALFRYTYGASVCIPLLFCFPYLKDSPNT